VEEFTVVAPAMTRSVILYLTMTFNLVYFKNVVLVAIEMSETAEECFSDHVHERRTICVCSQHSEAEKSTNAWVNTFGLARFESEKQGSLPACKKVES
jgi:hypothetical protein